MTRGERASMLAQPDHYMTDDYLELGVRVGIALWLENEVYYCGWRTGTRSQTTTSKTEQATEPRGHHGSGFFAAPITSGPQGKARRSTRALR